jgi:hypothetical protein
MRDQLTGSGIPPPSFAKSHCGAANGINPKDPRQTGGGGELDAAAALWKQRLDWHIALPPVHQATTGSSWAWCDRSAL